MIPEPGTPSTTQSIFPTRQFLFVIDPLYLDHILKPENEGTVALIADLLHADIPVLIRLVVPSYFRPAASPSPLQMRLGELLIVLVDQPSLPPFSLDTTIPEARRSAFYSDADAPYLMRLLELAEVTQADGIITSSPRLVDLRYVLRQHHRIRVVPFMEFEDIVEICAHGHSIFWSSQEPSRRLTFDVYYQTAHWKGKRASDWFSRMKDGMRDDELLQSLQSLLLNRLPFLLYSRDLVRFYELQRDYWM